MTGNSENEAAVRQWDRFPREAMEALEPEGDLVKRHLINPVVFGMLGDVSGRRILDAGCGTGYFSRMLADRGARVTGVEPAGAMLAYARERESVRRQGIDYLHADLTDASDLTGGFDAVVCNMVLMAIPDWKPALRTCVEALRPGGLLVFSITHPAFEQLRPTWLEYGEYRVSRYLRDYEVPQTLASDFHRPISAYLNEVAALGCRLREIAEPGLAPELAQETADSAPGLESYVHLPNVLVVAAERPPR